MKKSVWQSYLSQKNDKDPIAKGLARQHKKWLLKDSPKINEEFMTHAEKIHDLILSPHIPENLRQELFEHLQDIEEILGVDEDTESDAKTEDPQETQEITQQ